MKITIAVDGFSSCGKSTMAKDLARELNYVFIDTGAMYRALTYFALQNGMINTNGDIDEAGLCASLKDLSVAFKYDSKSGEARALLNGEDVEAEIRKPLVSSHVSNIAAIRQVREFLVAQQRKMGRAKGVVMDGRDIGTTVFPDAELKIFMTASEQVRAKRRYDEMLAKGIELSMEEVKTNIKERDYIDQTRDESPLRQADDAEVIDNTNLTPSQQLSVALEMAKARLAKLS
ncbi:MAG: (d)CMP kinase [Bacteroidales bacterium]